MAATNLWSLAEGSFDPARFPHQETVFTVGNGYLSTRGTFEEGYPGQIEATLIHGVYDDAPVVFTELVSAPNWTAFEIDVGDESFSLDSGEILAYQRKLDLRCGRLERSVRWRSPRGQTVELSFQRFASLARPQIALVQVAIKAIDFSGRVRVKAPINGATDTEGLTHWLWIAQRVEQGQAMLHLCTRASGIHLALAMRIHIDGGSQLQQEGWDARNHPVLVAESHLGVGETLCVEKAVALVTSRDFADPANQAWELVNTLPDQAWDVLERENQAAWEREWGVSDVIVEGDDEAQLAIRFNVFHLLICAPRGDDRVSIPAKTLSGYGYRGHIFWDTEIFILPFFTLVHPHVAKNLLTYRWHTLPEARLKAQHFGYSGAFYAWESALDGADVTPIWLPHPNNRFQLVRIWTGDTAFHISADIAYALVQYWNRTGDEDFFLKYGIEILIETARFYATRAEWSAERDSYEFKNVIGPDENHDRVDNNAYTNYLARWNLQTAAQVYEWLAHRDVRASQELAQRLSITEEEVSAWKNIAEKILLLFDNHTGLLEQFEGYYGLQDIDLSDLEPRVISAQALLGIEGVTRTQIIKQPDVMMLFHLFPEQFDQRIFQANYRYYTPRTDLAYGSSLGPAIQAILACRAEDLEQAYAWFLQAARADLSDVRGNAEDGIHAASAGGLWQAAVLGFGGLTFTPEGWQTHPRLPTHWKRLAFHFYYGGELHEVDIHNAS